jgi:hypothetical protein
MREPTEKDFTEYGSFDEEGFEEATEAWEDYNESKFEEMRDERMERENDDD